VTENIILVVSIFEVLQYILKYVKINRKFSPEFYGFLYFFIEKHEILL